MTYSIINCIYHKNNCSILVDPVINCLNMTLTNKNINGKIYLTCQILGEPSSEINIRWYRIFEKIKTNVTQGVRVYPINWGKASSVIIDQPEENEEIICEARNDLLKIANGTCYRNQTIQGKYKGKCIYLICIYTIKTSTID